MLESNNLHCASSNATRFQVFLLISVVLSHINAELGFGKHIFAVPLQNMPNISFNVTLCGTFSIYAAILSKTSFALTLLRISNGWMKILIWFIIVSINVSMGLSALFGWIQCSPVAKVWDITLPGTCWPPSGESPFLPRRHEMETNETHSNKVYATYGMVAAGKKPDRSSSAVSRQLIRDNSIFWRHGHITCHPPVEDDIGAADADEGEDWSRRRNEHGNLVSKSADQTGLQSKNGTDTTKAPEQPPSSRRLRFQHSSATATLRVSSTHPSVAATLHSIRPIADLISQTAGQSWSYGARPRRL